MATKKGIDYSKWDHIEVSDDEDDTHPNIDTPSLFRWRHQARVERMEEADKEAKSFEDEFKKHLEGYEATKSQLAKCENDPNAGDINDIKKKLKEFEIADKKLQERRTELEKKERLTPWNVDTLCKEGKTRTIINSKKEEPKQLTEDEQIERMRKFREENKSLIRKYGMLQKPDDSLNFLLDNMHLVDEDTANHLVLWCIDLAVEEKKDLMKHVAHQTMQMQFLLRLGTELKCNPKSCVRPFFAKFKSPEPAYQQAFKEELDAFIERVEKRAEERIAEAVKEYEEEEKKKRLGPGGLDPVEVFESLPEELQKCFESKDTDSLKDVLLKMDPKDAQYHMKRCVDSGMWVPGPDDGPDDADIEEIFDEVEEEDDEEAEEAAAEPEK